MQRVGERDAHCIDSFMDHEDEGHKMVLVGLNCIRETNLLIDENYHCHRFPAGAAQRFVELSFLIAQTTTALINRYHPALPLFHYTIKLHYTLHCALCSQYTNPLHGDCSSGEVLMKSAKRLVKGCLAGNPIHKVGSVALRKYLKGFHLLHDPSSPWWKIWVASHGALRHHVYHIVKKGGSHHKLFRFIVVRVGFPPPHPSFHAYSSGDAIFGISAKPVMISLSVIMLTPLCFTNSWMNAYN